MREKMVAENQEKMAAIGRKLTSLGSGGSALEGLQKELTSTVSNEKLTHFLIWYNIIVMISGRFKGAPLF